MTTIDYLALFSMPIAGAIIALVVYLNTGPKADDEARLSERAGRRAPER